MPRSFNSGLAAHLAFEGCLMPGHNSSAGSASKPTHCSSCPRQGQAAPGVPGGSLWLSERPFQIATWGPLLGGSGSAGRTAALQAGQTSWECGCLHTRGLSLTSAPQGFPIPSQCMACRTSGSGASWGPQRIRYVAERHGCGAAGRGADSDH